QHVPYMYGSEIREFLSRVQDIGYLHAKFLDKGEGVLRIEHFEAEEIGRGNGQASACVRSDHSGVGFADRLVEETEPARLYGCRDRSENMALAVIKLGHAQARS